MLSKNEYYTWLLLDLGSISYLLVLPHWLMLVTGHLRYIIDIGHCIIADLALPGPDVIKQAQGLSHNFENFQIGLKPALLQLHA